MSTSAFTILYRKGGKWTEDEIDRIIRATGAPCYGKTDFPEYILMGGRQRKRRIIDAIPGRTFFRLSWATDFQKLPFDPFK